jgi:hypothetical protein
VLRWGCAGWGRLFLLCSLPQDIPALLSSLTLFIPLTGCCRHCSTAHITTAAYSSPAAGDDVVAELLKEASMLGSLRHPNIVWVYGIVLPALSGGAAAAPAVTVVMCCPHCQVGLLRHPL